MMFPIERSKAPRTTAITFTQSSGAEVPIATIVSPTMRAGMPSLRAIEAVPVTK